MIRINAPESQRTLRNHKERNSIEFLSLYFIHIKACQGLTGKVWGLSKKLSDLGKESNRAKILLQ